MRIITFILILLFQGTVLFASADIVFPGNSKASGKEEVTAAWEREFQAEIFGDRVLSDFFKSKDAGFMINAFCSPGSIEKLSFFRKFAAEILSPNQHGNSSREEMVVAVVILAKIETHSLRPLNPGERRLISSIETSGFMDRFPGTRTFTGKSPATEYTPCNTGMALNFSPHIKLKSGNNQKQQYIYPVNKVICGKYFYDISHADLYRLFLYVKDSSGNGDNIRITYNSFLYSSPSGSIISHLHKITTNDKTRTTGAFS